MICLGVPTEPTLLTALGSPEKLNYGQAWEGLTIHPPSKRPCDHAATFKVLLG